MMISKTTKPVARADVPGIKLRKSEEGSVTGKMLGVTLMVVGAGVAVYGFYKGYPYQIAAHNIWNNIPLTT